jgi:hypothetical protein
VQITRGRRRQAADVVRAIKTPSSAEYKKKILPRIGGYTFTFSWKMA